MCNSIGFLDLWLISCRHSVSKGGFFSESAIHFSNLQVSKKNIPKSYPISKQQMVGSFKLRIVFWNIFFWRFGDLKSVSHFLKKATFKRQFHCTEVLQNNIFSKCNILMVYHFWLKQEKIDPRLNLKWIFVRTHKKQSFVLQLNLVNGEISIINNFGCQKSIKPLRTPKYFFCLHRKLLG